MRHMKKPVLFLNFNRPDYTARSFRQVQEYKPKRLYISVDGPRAQNERDHVGVARVREILDNVNWKCEVRRIYHPKNLGCKRAVQTALAEFFSREEEGIILEDDCIASPGFFRFTETLLEKYRDDERIAAIHGNCVGYKASSLKRKQSYFFTQFMNMWGWATWRRTYRLVDNSMRIWKAYDHKTRFTTQLLQAYGSELDHDWIGYWRHQFDRVADEAVDTWDFQWIFNILENRKLCVVPTENLVENIGWGADATHTVETNSPLKHNPVGKLRFPLKHPLEMQADLKYEKHIKRAWCSVRS